MTPEMKVIAVAAAVFALVQTIKQVFPNIAGWWALALNILLSAAGALSTAAPGTVFSPTTLTAVFLAIASAAGFHGTWTLLLNPQPTTPAKPNTETPCEKES